MDVVLADTGSSGFVAIQTSALVECRVLNQDGIEEELSNFEQKSGSIGLSSELEYFHEEFSPSLRKIRSQYPEIATWIEFQHNALTSLASQLNFQRALLSDLSPQQVTISAQELQFGSTTSCTTGDHLEIILSLGESLPTILLIGLVTDSEDPAAAERAPDTQQQIKATFTHIREPDQEMLIRHIHRAQLRELRSARDSREKHTPLTE